MSATTGRPSTREAVRPVTVGSALTTEFRGDICVVRPVEAAGGRIAEGLRAELRHCRAKGARDVVLDLDPCPALGRDDIAAIADAAHEFHEGGGELVVAVEEEKARRALAEAGLVRSAVPASPESTLTGEGSAVSLPERPRWQHEVTFRALPSELAVARRRITALAEVAGLHEPDLFEFSVAVAEALTNAVVHGSPRGSRDEVRVRFFCFDREVAAEVTDSGGGFSTSSICPPDTTQTTGRGIHFMRAMCDAVQFACSPRGTRVLLVKRQS